MSLLFFSGCYAIHTFLTLNFLISNSAYGVADVSVTLSLPPGVILSCGDLGQYMTHFSCEALVSYIIGKYGLYVIISCALYKHDAHALECALLSPFPHSWSASQWLELCIPISFSRNDQWFRLRGLRTRDTIITCMVEIAPIPWVAI